MMTEEREKAATPTLEGSFDMSFNDSVLSGYDADQEDEADSFRQLEYGKLATRNDQYHIIIIFTKRNAEWNVINICFKYQVIYS